MRKNFGAKPWTYPQPVFILATYDEDGTPDAMNAAWGGISEDKELSMCISAEHKTTANILARKAFTVSMATAEQTVACDYVGIESGNKVADKVAKAGWHTTKSEFVDAPLIDELPMAVECRLVSYDPESCRLVGEIVNVSADESVLDEAGKIDPDKLRPITFDPIHNAYRVLGEKVGNAFRDGIKLKLPAEFGRELPTLWGLVAPDPNNDQYLYHGKSGALTLSTPLFIVLFAGRPCPPTAPHTRRWGGRSGQ